MNTIIRFIFFLPMILFFFQGCSQTSENERYKASADSIISAVIKLQQKHFQMEGISWQDTTMQESGDCTIIELRWMDNKAKLDPPQEYYLIMNLTFYICRKPENQVSSDKVFQIGDMKVDVRVTGKGNEDLVNDIKEIIIEEKENFNKQ